MQTFLPYPSFSESAKCLDYRRLNKQGVECLQILNALVHKKGWIHHPATLQWRGYENCLVEYSLIMRAEWVNRGYKDSITDKLKSFFNPNGSMSVPNWLGNENFHKSHRSNLLRKDYAFYSKFGWTEPDNLEYIWPSKMIVMSK